MTLKKITKIIKNGELGWKLPKKIYLVSKDMNNFFYVKNKNLKERVLEDKEYHRIYNKYRIFINNYNADDANSTVNKTVWICWLQGIDKAPDLVKACVNSIEKYLKDFKIVVLTDSNIKEYVSFPKHIIEKYNKGMISRTHFSDILRAALLAEHGGLWIDSTVLCTDGSFADYIITLPLFAYKVMNLDLNDEEPIVCSSWLISSKSHNPIMLLTRDLLYEYWKTNNYITNFFLFHLMLSISARKYRKEWDNIPMFNNRSPHTLMFELGKEYSKNRWNQIERMSSFHKLTRHNDYNCPGSNYEYILNTYGKKVSS